MVSKTAKLFENVELGENATIGEFVIIGEPPQGATAGQLRTVIGRNAVIRSHTVIYAGNSIGDSFQTGHGVLVRELNDIGDSVSIGSHTVIEHHVRIGHRARVHSNAFVPEFSVLEDACWVGPNVVCTNAPYPQGRDVKATLKGPRVRTGAKIGANSTLLPGVDIGANALVGAGSVVVRDVAPGTVVAGNPARLLKTIRDIPAYREEP